MWPQQRRGRVKERRSMQKHRKRLRNVHPQHMELKETLGSHCSRGWMYCGEHNYGWIMFQGYVIFNEWNALKDLGRRKLIFSLVLRWYLLIDWSHQRRRCCTVESFLLRLLSDWVIFKDYKEKFSYLPVRELLLSAQSDNWDGQRRFYRLWMSYCLQRHRFNLWSNLKL